MKKTKNITTIILTGILGLGLMNSLTYAAAAKIPINTDFLSQLRLSLIKQLNAKNSQKANSLAPKAAKKQPSAEPTAPAPTPASVPTPVSAPAPASRPAKKQGTLIPAPIPAPAPKPIKTKPAIVVESLQKLVQAAQTSDFEAIKQLLLTAPDIDIAFADAMKNDKFVSQMVAAGIDFSSALFDAAITGDSTMTDLLINAKVNVNATNEESCTPLILATRHNHIKIVKQLITNKANVDSANNNGETALMIAAATGNESIITLLLKTNPKINAVDKNQRTALSIAVSNKQVSIVRQLLQAGADTDTILKKALENQSASDSQYVQTMVEAGANFENVLLDAATKNSLRTIQFLHKATVNIEALDTQSRTVLIVAAEKGYNPIVDYLIAAGANINAVDRRGHTPLSISAFNNHQIIVGQLLQAGVDINNALTNALKIKKTVAAMVAAGVDFGKALLNAAMSDNLETVHLLLEANVSVDTPDEEGNTALMLAVNNDRAPIVEHLISKKANVDRVNSQGQTALMLAASNGNALIANRLLQTNPDVNLIDRNNNTAIMIAIRNNDYAIIDLLIEKNALIDANDSAMVAVGVNLGYALINAATSGNLETVRYLLNANVNINTTDKQNNTVLMLAAKNGHEQIVELLISRNANIDSTNNIGQTALIIAALNARTSIANLLLQANPNVNAIDKNKRTALMMAIISSCDAISELLIEKKANIDARDKEGGTALMMASSLGNTKIARQLINAHANIWIADQMGRTALAIATLKNRTEIVELLSGAPVGSNTINHVPVACDTDFAKVGPATLAADQTPTVLYTKRESPVDTQMTGARKSPPTIASQPLPATEAQKTVERKSPPTIASQLLPATEAQMTVAPAMKETTDYIEIDTPHATYIFYKLSPSRIIQKALPFDYDTTLGRPGHYIGKWNDSEIMTHYPSWFKNDATCAHVGRKNIPHLLFKAIPQDADSLLGSDAIAFPNAYIDNQGKQIKTLNIIGCIIPKIVLTGNGTIKINPNSHIKPINCVYTWGFRNDGKICYHRCAEAINAKPDWLITFSQKKKVGAEFKKENYEADFPTLTPDQPASSASNQITTAVATKWLVATLGSDRFRNEQYEKTDYASGFPTLELTTPAQSAPTTATQLADKGKGPARAFMPILLATEIERAKMHESEIARQLTQTPQMGTDDQDEMSAAIALSLENNGKI